MDAITNSMINPPLSQPTKNLDKNYPTLQSQSTTDQTNNPTVANGTVNLSPTGIKLSSSTPVQSSDIAAPINNTDQAQQALNRLISDFQSNPAQAQGAHSTIFSNSVKSLLG